MPPRDTHPKMRELQWEILRRMTPAERLQKALDQSQFVMDAARAAIRRANPEANEQELKLLCIRHFYGNDVAAMVERLMQAETTDYDSD